MGDEEQICISTKHDNIDSAIPIGHVERAACTRSKNQKPTEIEYLTPLLLLSLSSGLLSRPGSLRKRMDVVRTYCDLVLFLQSHEMMTGDDKETSKR